MDTRREQINTDFAVEHVITRSGRYRKIADSLQVKEVTIGDGEPRRRYVVCYNPDEERRQRKRRAQVIRELEEELEVLQDLDSNSYTKRISDARRLAALWTLSPPNEGGEAPTRSSRGAAR